MRSRGDILLHQVVAQVGHVWMGELSRVLQGAALLSRVEMLLL